MVIAAAGLIRATRTMTDPIALRGKEVTPDL
jgi:hypothetical protein